MQELVGLGQGVSLVPEMAARADRGHKIVYRTLAGDKASRTLAMVWNMRRYRSSLVMGLIDTIRTESVRKARPS